MNPEDAESAAALNERTSGRVNWRQLSEKRTKQVPSKEGETSVKTVRREEEEGRSSGRRAR
ncbi:hypothetical protein INR49_008895 [Caranx melampygus]|nr:hypothetical protein INR49_008895 [Caranx melampygus]